MKKDPGGDECDYGEKDDGSCYTLAERDAKRDAERDKKAEEEKNAEAAQARAKALFGLLKPASNPPTEPTTRAAFGGEGGGDLNTAFGDAGKALGTIVTKEKASIVVMTTKGPDVESVNHAEVSATAADPGNGVITLEANAKYISGSGFASSESVILTHGDEKGNAEKTVSGSYKGATGDFVCANSCMSQRTKDGIKLTGSGWSFSLDRGQKYKLEDPIYAHFGWWINEAATSAPKVGAWYGTDPNGLGAFTDTNLTGITAEQITAATGSATYTGDAVGQAVFYDATTDDENIGGAFTATATLTADFGTDMLGGEIAGFKVGGVDTDWKVELEKESFATQLGVLTGDDTNTKWTAGGTAADSAGEWSAYFYDKPEEQHQPKGVAGGFLAEHGDEGRMIGAFGAER